MSNQFYPGQKVVCVDDAPGARWPYRPVSKGSVYMIRGVSMCPGGAISLDLGMTYKDGSECFCCEHRWSGITWWLRSTRFRPLETLSEQVTRIEEEAVSAPAEVETLETVEV